MARKIDPRTRDTDVIANTIKEMLGDKNLIAPVCITRLIDCVDLLPFSLTIYFDKVYGKWAVSNQDLVTIREHSKTDFNGLNFTVVEFTLEMALARAIHYYYHTEEKNNGILHCEIG